MAYLARLFPGKSEQEYRGYLGAFGITGMTGLQLIGTLSGGQKSRVSFAILVSVCFVEDCVEVWSLMFVGMEFVVAATAPYLDSR